MGLGVSSSSMCFEDRKKWLPFWQMNPLGEPHGLFCHWEFKNGSNSTQSSNEPVYVGVGKLLYQGENDPKTMFLNNDFYSKGNALYYFIKKLKQNSMNTTPCLTSVIQI